VLIVDSQISKETESVRVEGRVSDDNSEGATKIYLCQWDTRQLQLRKHEKSCFGDLSGSFLECH